LTNYDFQVPGPDGTGTFIFRKTLHVSGPGKRISVVADREITGQHAEVRIRPGFKCSWGPKHL
jgi:hypothetical protein